MKTFGFQHHSAVLLLVAQVVSAMMMIPRAHVHNIHLNNAGDSPSPPEVTDAIIQHMQLETEVGGYRAADLANEEGRMDAVYTSVAHLINADDKGGTYDAKNEIALVESATVGWTRFFYSALETRERELLTAMAAENAVEVKEQIILVSDAEYAANVVAAVKFARDHTLQTNSRIRWRVFPIPSSTLKDVDGETVNTGTIDLDAFRSILSGEYKIEGDSDEETCLDPTTIAMVCITHIPTNSGIVNPVNDIGSLIRDFNGGKVDSKLPQILYLVDACQSAGQIVVDVQTMHCHALAATGRKYIRGPRGTGFLYIPHPVANLLEPSHIDHAAAPVSNVLKSAAWTRGLEGDGNDGLRYTYKEGAARFEFWESNAANRLGLGAAIDVTLAAGKENIEKQIVSLGKSLREQLRGMDGITVYHGNFCACGIVTFSIQGKDPVSIKQRLQDGVRLVDDSENVYCFHIATSPGSSTPVDTSKTGLGLGMLLRASVSYFNTVDEIKLFCKALDVVRNEGS